MVQRSVTDVPKPLHNFESVLQYSHITNKTQAARIADSLRFSSFIRFNFQAILPE